jgi:hypothetical protein
MVLGMKEPLLMDRSKASVNYFLQMALYMKVNLRIMKSMEKEFILGLMAKNM